MEQQAQFINDVAAAKILSVSPQTLRNWRHIGGRGPIYCKKNKMVRYLVKDLFDYMNAGRIDPQAARG